MAENKTQKTGGSVSEFMNGIADRQKRADCRAIGRMMRAATGKRAAMWGSSIVGYGDYGYRYASGREGAWMLTGYSPRAQNLSIYIMPGFSTFGALLKKLGPHKTGKSCLYIKRLADIDEDVLADLIDRSVRLMQKKYGA